MERAYTLIEILVGITVIALLFLFGYASFRDFSRRQAMNSAARTIRGDLRLAQEQALSGNKPANPTDPKCEAPNVLNGYYFRAASTSYAIEVACSGGTVTAKNVNLPSDISLTAPSPNPILFKVLGQGTNLTASDATIILTQAGTLNTQTITVTSGGEIK